MNNEKTRLLDRPSVHPKGFAEKNKRPYGGCTHVHIPQTLGEEYLIQYEPLSRKQLLKYEDDVWWKNLRRGLMIGFWASMMLLVLSAVLIAAFQYEHVCVAKKSFLPMPTSTEVPIRTTYGLYPISSQNEAVEASDKPSPPSTSTHSNILPFSIWLGP